MSKEGLKTVVKDKPSFLEVLKGYEDYPGQFDEYINKKTDRRT